MPHRVLADHLCADMMVRYRTDDAGQVGLELIPASLASLVCEVKPFRIDSLVQVALRGDRSCPGWAAGHSMRDSASTTELRFDGQSVTDGPSRTIETRLRGKGGLVATHRLRWRGGRFVETSTLLRNEGDAPMTLEMLSSFSLGGLTPFREDEAAGVMLVHRLRSIWSAEGRLTTESVEDLQLEPSWLRHGVRVERFGQVGSMPVRKFFPFVAIEDTTAGAIWAAQVACPSSWQIELYRRDQGLCVSGGLADFEFGHWAKTLQPGQEFETPVALLTVGTEPLDEVCQRLLDPAANTPSRSRPAPLFFNEFCTTWGKPSQELIGSMLRVLKGRGFTHFVIDAGWYADKERGWNRNHGEWVVSPELFPNGLQATVDQIRAAGLVPGIWFEWETVGDHSVVFENTEHLLKRHGHPLTAGERRFWDMADPWVVDYLSQKVIGLLRAYGFEYLKTDYNENIGVGCDGAESLGEGLRQRILGTQAFFRKIREGVPGVQIENCSSGGHRLEHSMMALCDYASFSDAHECLEIPIIAANLHRVILPAQSQIWAVVRRDDSVRRIVYSVVNTFLGIPCLSGDILEMTDVQWSWVTRGWEFYRSVFPLIEQGTTRIFGPDVESYRDPHGWQAVLRTGQAGALALVHSFHGSWPATVEIPLGFDGELDEWYGTEDTEVTVEPGLLKVVLREAFAAVAVRLVRRGRV